MDLGLGDGRAEGQRGQRGEPGQIRRSVVRRSWGGKGRTIVQDPWWQKAKGKRLQGGRKRCSCHNGHHQWDGHVPVTWRFAVARRGRRVLRTLPAQTEGK
jgi:hypothetical protein